MACLALALTLEGHLNASTLVRALHYIRDKQTNIRYGDTVIIDALGQRVAECTDSGADEVIIADLSLAHLKDIRDRIPLGECGATQAELSSALERALSQK